MKEALLGIAILILGFMLYRAERDISKVKSQLVDNQLELLSQTDKLHSKVDAVDGFVRKRLSIARPKRNPNPVCLESKGTNPNGCGGLPKTTR